VYSNTAGLCPDLASTKGDSNTITIIRTTPTTVPTGQLSLTQILDFSNASQFTPDYAIDNLLRAEIAANTAISSYFLFTVGVTTFSKKILAGISVFIALSTLVTIPIA
jgi:hypothetical protein